MSKLPLFEDFIPIGFGTSGGSSYSMGANTYANTGYNMNAIIGPVTEVGKCIAKEAYTYESDDDPNHTAESYIKEAKKHINNKIDEACEGYSQTNEKRDPQSIRKEYDDLKKMSVQSLRDRWSRSYRIGNPKELDKVGLIMDILVAKHGARYIHAAFESITEANDYEYDPSAHAERLKRREEQNIERFRAAQDRGDNYAIALYELKIKMDKIDLEKLKVLKAIDDLKKKFDKK
jgi:hypothetical protein